MISRQTISFGLRRLGLALLLIFVVNSLFGLLPLQIVKPAWQLRVTDLLLTTAPFTLLGTALLFLAERQASHQAKVRLSVKQIRKLARPATIGFLLLIPLQTHAIWSQIRTADFEAQKTIRTVERRVSAVKSVASSEDLLRLSTGLPADWQPMPKASLPENRQRLLARIEPELARLRTTVDQRKRQAIQLGLKDGTSNLLLALIYAWAFEGVRQGQGLPGLAPELDAATEELTRNTETDPSAPKPNNEWF
jgi:hypothetical protein